MIMRWNELVGTAVSTVNSQDEVKNFATKGHPQQARQRVDRAHLHVLTRPINADLPSNQPNDVNGLSESTESKWSTYERSSPQIPYPIRSNSISVKWERRLDCPGVQGMI